MLKRINPLLGPDLLHSLRAMGHGDEIAIVDGNYPALEHARRLVRADGHGILAVLDAILSLLPLDDFVEHAVFLPEPPSPQPIHDALRETVARHDADAAVRVLPAAGFYARVRDAHCVVATGEPLLYANIIVRKGVIRPE